MVEVRLPEGQRHAQQQVDTIRVEGEVATLTGPSLEIRLPAGWARKLLPWYRGPGRTILCNADTRRYNLVGVTKVGDHLLLSYVDRKGDLTAERVSGDLVEVLDGLLPGTGVEEPG